MKITVKHYVEYRHATIEQLEAASEFVENEQGLVTYIVEIWS